MPPGGAKRRGLMRWWIRGFYVSSEVGMTLMSEWATRYTLECFQWLRRNQVAIKAPLKREETPMAQ